MGDFNSHFGLECQYTFPRNFGSVLHHEITNENGLDVIQLCVDNDLLVLTTIKHKSTRVTWSSGNRSSQIDHVFKPRNASYKVINLLGMWTSYPTDHKLLTCTIRMAQNVHIYERFKYPHLSIYRSNTWNLKALTNPSIQEKFDELFNQCVSSEIHHNANLKHSWDLISKVACYCAEKLLKVKNQYSDDQINAFREHKALMNRVMRFRTVDINPDLVDPHNDYPPNLQPGSRHLVRHSLRNLQNVSANSSHNRLRAFLHRLNDEAPCPGQRLQSTFNFVKKARRTQVCLTNVDIKHWERELSKSVGETIAEINEVDHFPLMKPPSYDEIEREIARMKNNKAPGSDKVCVEMLKASATLRFMTFRIIRHVYLTNEVPLAWQQTFSVPIPKIKNPKTVDDFRKLTMCSKVYQLYARCLMTQLNVFVPAITNYQCGFELNRSCDDALFIVKRILEERWNRGFRTYIFSYDLRKAFDSVLISTLPAILQKYSVPDYLINRIIKAILTENNCILWKGQFTRWFPKNIGIKQGCVLSPRLFNIIMNEAVMATKIILASINIYLYTGDKNEELNLPAFICFADDMHLLADSLEEGIIISEILLTELAKYGLELNAEKSGILIKGILIDAPPHVQILDHEVKFVNTIKFLGSTINNNMERKSSIHSRLHSTRKLFKGLLPYLSELKAPIELLMQFYSLVIVPCMLYGLKSMSVTSQNKATLMRREITMVKELSSIAYPKPAQQSIAKLLKYQTINRRMTVSRVRYFGHIVRSNQQSMLKRAYKYNLNGCRRRPGRPLFTFHKSLLQDFNKYSDFMTIDDWSECFPFKEILKRVTSELYDRMDLSDDVLSEEVNLYNADELIMDLQGD